MSIGRDRFRSTPLEHLAEKSIDQESISVKYSCGSRQLRARLSRVSADPSWLLRGKRTRKFGGLVESCPALKTDSFIFCKWSEYWQLYVRMRVSRSMLEAESEWLILWNLIVPKPSLRANQMPKALWVILWSLLEKWWAMVLHVESNLGDAESRETVEINYAGVPFRCSLSCLRAPLISEPLPCLWENVQMTEPRWLGQKGLFQITAPCWRSSADSMGKIHTADPKPQG